MNVNVIRSTIAAALFLSSFAMVGCGSTAVPSAKAVGNVSSYTPSENLALDRYDHGAVRR